MMKFTMKKSFELSGMIFSWWISSFGVDVFTHVSDFESNNFSNAVFDNLVYHNLNFVEPR
jgi:hypothetical protein